MWKPAVKGHAITIRIGCVGRYVAKETAYLLISKSGQDVASLNQSIGVSWSRGEEDRQTQWYESMVWVWISCLQSLGARAH